MAKEMKSGLTTSNRQAAYTARNRAALIRAGQEVLAEIGPAATIEQLAAHAEVSPTTIYKYFENKDLLFLEALGGALNSWLMWAATQNQSPDRLQRIIELPRRLFRTQQTHPLFSQMLHNSLSYNPNFMFDADGGEAKKVFNALANAGEVKIDEFEERFAIWAHSVSGLARSVLVDETLSPEQADIALGFALSAWGISEAKAKKLVSRKLDVKPTK
jgi:AcrR family transcriptional regulator